MTSDVTIYLTGQKFFIFIGLIERTTLKLSRWNPFLLFSTCDSLDPENVFFIVPANWLDSQASGYKGPGQIIIQRSGQTNNTPLD